MAAGILVEASICRGEEAPPIAIRVVLWAILTAACLIGCIAVRHPAVRTWLLVSLFFPLGAAILATQDAARLGSSLRQIAAAEPQPVLAEGILDRPVVVRKLATGPAVHPSGRSTWRTEMQLQVDRLRVGRSMVGCRGRAMVMLDGRCESYQPGDRVRVYGSLQSFPAPRNPGEVDRSLRSLEQRLDAQIHLRDSGQLELLPHRQSLRLIPTRCSAWLARQAHMEVFYLDYREMTREPLVQCARLVEFLRVDADPAELAGVVDADLYRQRR